MLVKCIELWNNVTNVIEEKNGMDCDDSESVHNKK